MIQTGEYTCLEILLRTAEGKNGYVILRDTEGRECRYDAGQKYYRWLKLPVKRQSCYEIISREAEISLAYLSGCEKILEEGIRYIDPMDGGQCLSTREATEYYDTPYREQYHFAPWKNWMNDPNGLCWYQGYYHMYYQYNPHGQEWNNMYWGHAVSPDLVHWTHLPIVLEPQKEVLEQADMLKGGAFSGSAIALENETVFYLTRHLGPMEDGEETVQQQWMTRSHDMLEFEPEKLVIEERPKGASFDFRDPKVVKIGDMWYMVLASTMNGQAAILLYKSRDMEHWSYVKPLLTEEEEGVRCFECPDFFPLDGSFAAWGALMCHRDASGRYQMSRYYIGEFKDEEFSMKSTGWYDFGSNCYAMQSFEHEGRRIAIGWISDFYGEHVEVENGAYGSTTIPRVLHVKKNKLYMSPVEEIHTLKGHNLYTGEKENINLQHIPGNSFYAGITFSEDTDFNLLLGRDGKKEIRFIKEKGFTGIRTFGVKSECAVFPADVDTVTQMEIFVDRRVVEIYLNGGEAAGTKLFYNSAEDGCFVLEAAKPWAVKQAEVSKMQSIWQ